MTLDERLYQRLQEIVERQSLARFDNIMFLAYPLLIATSTLLVSMVWNYAALEKLHIFGQPARDVLIVSIGFLLVVAVPSFFGFLLAYMRDNMPGRLLAYARFLFVCGVLPIFFAVLPAALSLHAGLGELKVPSQLCNLMISVPLVFSAASLWVVLVSRACLRLLGWFEQNVPTRFVSVRHSDRFYQNWSYTFLIGAKFGLAVCCVVWIPVTALLLTRNGLSQVAFNNLLSLVGLIGVGVLVWPEK